MNFNFDTLTKHLNFVLLGSDFINIVIACFRSGCRGARYSFFEIIEKHEDLISERVFVAEKRVSRQAYLKSYLEWLPDFS